MDNLFDLTNKTAIITGGAGLLAAEHAKALSMYGANVILADINVEKCETASQQLQKENYKVTAMHCDITSQESWQQLLQNVLEQFGVADILINNAAYTNQSKTKNFDASFENFSLDDWNNIINVNLTGTFLGCQIIGAQMKKQGKGSIINMGSLYAVVSPHHRMYPGTGITQPVAYTVSKHGIIGLTKYLATLWAADGVRVNALSPGGIYNNHADEFVQRFSNLNPAARMSKVTELQGAVVLLASDASSHVIGHNLIVDGGWTVW
ncbi:MAG TPA: SDR family oxidoreductase [Chitinophagaceae bacterium]|nr:SDR family oxidoreductase [Chitinophagaceae bacterium]